MLKETLFEFATFAAFFGAMGIIYIICWLITEKENRIFEERQRKIREIFSVEPISNKGSNSEMDKLKIVWAGKRNEISLNDISLTECCISCDIHITAGHRVATLVLICDEIDLEDDNIETVIENQSYNPSQP